MKTYHVIDIDGTIHVRHSVKSAAILAHELAGKLAKAELAGKIQYDDDGGRHTILVQSGMIILLPNYREK